MITPWDRPEARSNARLRVGRDHVDANACGLAFFCHRNRQTNHTGLRHRIHRAVFESAVASTGRNVDDAPASVLLHDTPGSTTNIQRSHQLRRDDGVDVFIGEVRERLHSDLPGVVHTNVDCPECVERCLNNRVGTFDGCDRVVVRNSLSACSNDLGHNFVGRIDRGGITGVIGVTNGDAEIVHDNPGSPSGQEERVLTPQTTPGSCDYRYRTIEREFVHACSLVQERRPQCP